MVSSQLSGGAPMRCTNIIGSQADYMQPHSIKPQHAPCPPCGKQGKRTPVIVRRLPHRAALHRRAWMVAEVGGDKARGACGQYFQAPLPGVPSRGRYAYEVRTTVANAMIRERMPYELVSRRRQEDDRLTLSLGSIHACCLWAQEQINLETRWDCVRTNFAGVLCLDAVHARGRPMLCATDPLGDLTVSFTGVRSEERRGG